MTLALPATAPFSREEIETLNDVVGRSSPAQRAWLSGFLAGLEARGPELRTGPEPRVKDPLTIIYASESGNAEALAMAAKSMAAKQGFDVRLHDMADIDLAVLQRAKNLVVYASTWGEGDPPERAANLYHGLMSDDAPSLAGINFAVLALGDSAYANFCETGCRIDARLEALGANRVADRIDLDLDFAAHAPKWTSKVLDGLKSRGADGNGTVLHVDFQHSAENSRQVADAYTAERPLRAEISALLNLNGTGSTHETWHVELQTHASGFTYQPGDAIGILPVNDPELVARLLDVTGLSGNDELATHITRQSDITTLSRNAVERYAALTGRKELAELAADTATFQAYTHERQLIDLFREYPEKLTAEQLKGLLRPLPPRLYSVASSQSAHDEETHLLIGAVRWSAHGLERRGVASTYVGDRRKIGDTLDIYVKPNRHFRLPSDPGLPIIMIGAGTGIAPFRGFVAERAAQEARGKSWLFFGERNYTHDFLYQLEWQEHLATGALSRIDVAFSRDQSEKIYVQHRLWEQREEIRNWIGDGAHIYVCGSEQGLWRDVNTTLARILAESRGGDDEHGTSELAALTKAGRFQRDVY